MNCIKCDKHIPILESFRDKTELEYIFSKETDKCCWRDGLVKKVSAGYGSRRDGNEYILAICDTCLDELQEQGKIYYVGDYMLYPTLDTEQINKSKELFTAKDRVNKLGKI